MYIPTDYRLVPIKPTKEMRSAAGLAESAAVKARQVFFAGDSWEPMVLNAPEFPVLLWPCDLQDAFEAQLKHDHQDATEPPDFTCEGEEGDYVCPITQQAWAAFQSGAAYTHLNTVDPQPGTLAELGVEDIANLLANELEAATSASQDASVDREALERIALLALRQIKAQSVQVQALGMDRLREENKRLHTHLNERETQQVEVDHNSLDAAHAEAMQYKAASDAASARLADVEGVLLNVPTIILRTYGCAQSAHHIDRLVASSKFRPRYICHKCNAETPPPAAYKFYVQCACGATTAATAAYTS